MREAFQRLVDIPLAGCVYNNAYVHNNFFLLVVATSAKTM